MDEKLLHDAHDIFCEVFHSKISYETFRHKHLDNPDIDVSLDLVTEIASLDDKFEFEVLSHGVI